MHGVDWSKLEHCFSAELRLHSLKRNEKYRESLSVVSTHASVFQITNSTEPKDDKHCPVSNRHLSEIPNFYSLVMGYAGEYVAYILIKVHHLETGLWGALCLDILITQSSQGGRNEIILWCTVARPGNFK